jgi:protein-S-isoprenylcysteine O-methyltransferase Ste14
MGGLLSALGAALVLPSMWNFAVVGRGTPAPIDPPRVLVTRAWYRRVRNPMYIGIATIIIGEGVMFRSWTLLGYAVLFLVFCHLFVVLYEEPALRRKFGASYETYRAAVPRWIPGRRS